MTLECKHCIHFKTCGARVDIRSLIIKWNEKYPGILFNEEQNLANNCDDYKSLSDLHFSESLNFRKFMERIYQINELRKKQKEQTVSEKEENELTYALTDARKLYDSLDESEKHCAINYSRVLRGAIFE